MPARVIFTLTAFALLEISLFLVVLFKKLMSQYEFGLIKDFRHVYLWMCMVLIEIYIFILINLNTSLKTLLLFNVWNISENNMQ